MNGKNISRIAVLTTCLGFAATVDAFVGQIAVGLGQMNEIGAIETSFAADAKVETEDMNVNTKIFYKPGMLRDEMKMGGQEMVTIRRFDTNKFWMIMGQGMYMEIDPEAGSEQVQQFRLIEREVIGRETINGMETTKYKSVYETRDGKFGGFTWFTDDNIAVKAFMIHETKGEKQRVRFEITDLRRGEQADSMFEIPAGYQKFNMGNFGGMPGAGGMGGMGGAATQGSAGRPTSTDSEPDITDEVTNAAIEGAEEAAVEETKRGVKDSVSRGIRGLFGK